MATPAAAATLVVRRTFFCADAAPTRARLRRTSEPPTLSVAPPPPAVYALRECEWRPAQAQAKATPQLQSAAKPAAECGGLLPAKAASESTTADAEGSPLSSSRHSVAAETRTTVMMRNLPGPVSRKHLVDILTAEGFLGEFDFLYLPIDFKTGANQGFAFVNLTTPEAAQRLQRAFHRFDRWCARPGRRCNVSWAREDQQGLAANVRRFRNSTVMHHSVAASHRPLLLVDGVEVAFPKPNRQLWAPRGRGRGAGF